MVPGCEFEFPGFAPAADDLVVLRLGSDGGIRVGHVGNDQEDGPQVGLHLLGAPLQLGNVFAQSFSFLDEGLFFLRIFLLADEFGLLVPAKDDSGR